MVAGAWGRDWGGGPVGRTLSPEVITPENLAGSSSAPAVGPGAASHLRGVVHARGRAALSTCHRLAHATWKRNLRPLFSSTSCSPSLGQMVASQPSHNLCPVTWLPRVLTGATLGRMPYQSLSRMRCDAGSIATSKLYRRGRRPRGRDRPPEAAPWGSQ